MSADHPDWNCPNCIECEGCDGGSGKWPRNPLIAEFSTGLITAGCADCNDEGLICDCQCHPLAEEATA